MNLYYSYSREAFRLGPPEDLQRNGEVLVKEEVSQESFLPLGDSLNKVMSEFLGVSNIALEGFYTIED